jgi:hypothetical protein
VPRHLRGAAAVAGKAAFQVIGLALLFLVSRAIPPGFVGGLLAVASFRVRFEYCVYFV